MTEIFYDDEADLSIIQGRHVAVLGYGSQGHAHALSLRDSGVDVRVGLPEGSKSREKAEADGLRVLSPAEAVEEADLTMILAPDHIQRHLYADHVAPNLVEGDALFFGHGLNIRYGLIEAPEGVDVAMVAPKGPGHLVRRQYTAGRGVPVLVAVEKDASGNAWDLALSYAKGIGGTRAGVLEDDLHRGDRDRPLRRAGRPLRRPGRADQGRLRDPGRGRLPARGRLLRVPARDEADRRPHVRGRHRTRCATRSPTPPSTATTPVARASSTAETKKEMKSILAEIQSGEFAKELVEEFDSGQKKFTAYRAELAEHPIEKTGAKLRPMMSWLK